MIDEGVPNQLFVSIYFGLEPIFRYDPQGASLLGFLTLELNAVGLLDIVSFRFVLLCRLRIVLECNRL